MLVDLKKKTLSKNYESLFPIIRDRWEKMIDEGYSVQPVTQEDQDRHKNVREAIQKFEIDYLNSQREDGTYQENLASPTANSKLKEEKKKWDPITESEKKLKVLKQLLEKIKVPPKPKCEFIDPEFNYEQRDKNRKSLWQKVSRMRHSKFELASLQNVKSRVGHFKTSFQTPRDRLINLDPIEIKTSESIDKINSKSPLSSGMFS